MGITKTIPNRRKRNKNSEANQPELSKPIAITAAVAAGSTLTVTFDGPVALDRGAVPQYVVDVAGADPVSVVQTAPNIIAITYDAAIAAATTVTIPYHDPAVRNKVGGYVSTSTFKIA